MHSVNRSGDGIVYIPKAQDEVSRQEADIHQLEAEINYQLVNEKIEEQTRLKEVTNKEDTKEYIKIENVSQSQSPE